MKKIKINWVDIGVLLLILIMILAVRARFQKYNTVDSKESSLEKITYTMTFSPIRDFTIEAFAVGDVLYDSMTNVAIGTITNKSYQEYEEYSALMDGTTVLRTQPDRFELTLEVETEGIINGSGYYANKTVELKVGSEKAVETRYAKSTGRITSIQAKTAEE